MPGSGMKQQRVTARILATAVAGVLGTAGCSLFHGRPTPGPGQVGTASWYGPGFRGQRTASGAHFDEHEFSAAHRSLPLGTRVRVTNLANGRSVVVRINDRGPFVRGRLIDVSYGAARALGMVRRGTARVRLEVLDAATPSVTTARARVHRRTRRRRGAAAHP